LFAPPGRVVVTLHALDGRSLTREVELSAGQVTRERMEFSVAVTAVAANPTLTPPRVLPPPDRPLPPPTPTEGTSSRRVLAWTAAGIAAAGFGLALVSWRVREGVVTSDIVECPVAASTEENCGAEWGTADGERAQWEAVTTVGLIAGGAFAVTSAILFATEPSRGAPPTT
jgi:hypothetical protein